MKKLLVILLLGAAFWHYYLDRPGSPVITNVGHDGSQLERPVIIQQTSSFSQAARPSSSAFGQPAARTSTANYRCDGRTHCSQMTSCAEATYFLRNCPGVKMDGNNDGIPCERQWCR